MEVIYLYKLSVQDNILANKFQPKELVSTKYEHDQKFFGEIEEHLLVLAG